MTRIRFSALLAAVIIGSSSAVHGAIIDLLNNPGALPPGKPATVTVTAVAGSDGFMGNYAITLTAVESAAFISALTLGGSLSFRPANANSQ